MRPGSWPAMALVASILAGCTGPLEPEAPEPTGQIDGAVVGPLLDPYAGLPVHLLELDRIDVTSDLGGFTFRNVPVGVYTLEAQFPGTKGSIVRVVVSEDRITPTIMQLLPEDPPIGIRDFLTHGGGTGDGLAMPGAECTGCAWTIPLQAHPEEVVIGASWEDFAGQGGEVIVRVYDANNMLLRTLDGDSPVRGSIPGTDIRPGQEHLRLSVEFAEDFTPQPDFQFEAYAELYFGATRAVCLDQPECVDPS